MTFSTVPPLSSGWGDTLGRSQLWMQSCRLWKITLKRSSNWSIAFFRACILSCGAHREVVDSRNTKQPNLGIRPRHPGVELVAKEPVTWCGRTC